MISAAPAAADTARLPHLYRAERFPSCPWRILSIGTVTALARRPCIFVRSCARILLPGKLSRSQRQRSYTRRIPCRFQEGPQLPTRCLLLSRQSVLSSRRSASGRIHFPLQMPPSAFRKLHCIYERHADFSVRGIDLKLYAEIRYICDFFPIERDHCAFRCRDHQIHVFP